MWLSKEFGYLGPLQKVKNPGPQDLVLLLPPERGLGSCPLRRQERVIPKGFIRN